MANENYRKLLKDIHARRRILTIPENAENFQTIEEYLEYLADNEYNLGWAELGNKELFPYEKRTLTNAVLNLDIEVIANDLPNSKILALKQYLCPCCQAMTKIDFEISGKPHELTITYLPPNWRSDVQIFIGKNLTLQQMLDFPGIDETGRIKQVTGELK
jgi:hypothetical protein